MPVPKADAEIEQAGAISLSDDSSPREAPSTRHAPCYASIHHVF